jgi:hypothetical protein
LVHVLCDEGFSGGRELFVSMVTSEIATIDARKPRPSFRVWAIPVFTASIAISALGILLFGPSSLKIQRSVAARDRSTVPLFSVPGTLVYQSLLPDEASTLPLQSAKPIAPKGRFYVSVHATDRSWVVVCADGKVLFSRLFTNGDGHTVEFNRDAIVRVGSAGSVQIVRDGKFTGMLGKIGEVRIVEFTPEASYSLNGGEAEDCTQGH